MKEAAYKMQSPSHQGFGWFYQGRRLGVSFCRLALCVTWLVLAETAYCEESKWAYVYAESLSNEYRVFKGPANVTIRDGKVEAKMTFQHGEAFELLGTLEGGNVKARFTTLDSDAGSIPFSGTYRVLHLKHTADESLGRESIVVTDGYSVLGLTREITK